MERVSICPNTPNSGRISKKYVEWKKSMRGCKFWFQPDNKICRVETKNMSGSLIFFEPVMFLCRVKFFAKISKWNKSIWLKLRAKEKIRSPPACNRAHVKYLQLCQSHLIQKLFTFLTIFQDFWFLNPTHFYVGFTKIVTLFLF